MIPKKSLMVNASEGRVVDDALRARNKVPRPREALMATAAPALLRHSLHVQDDPPPSFLRARRHQNELRPVGGLPCVLGVFAADGLPVKSGGSTLVPGTDL
jgi:hypothetical protein